MMVMVMQWLMTSLYWHRNHHHYYHHSISIISYHQLSTYLHRNELSSVDLRVSHRPLRYWWSLYSSSSSKERNMIITTISSSPFIMAFIITITIIILTSWRWSQLPFSLPRICWPACRDGTSVRTCDMRSWSGSHLHLEEHLQGMMIVIVMMMIVMMRHGYCSHSGDIKIMWMTVWSDNGQHQLQ